MTIRINTFWKLRHWILFGVAVGFMVGRCHSTALADDQLILQGAEIVAPAAKTDKVQAVAPDEVKAAADKAAKNAKAEAKVKAEALKRRAVVQRGALNVANQQNIEQQIRAQFEPMLKVELSFANRTANLNDDERRKLIAASKKWFDEFIGPFIKRQDPNERQMMLQGMNGVWFGGNTPNRDDPRKMIQSGVAKMVSETIPQEKRDKYDSECRQREEFVRTATVDNLVSRIDEKVILSSNQRKKITDSLIKHWSESTPPQLEAFAMSVSMWPGIPEQWVLPELTESQKAVLSGINRTSGHVFMGGMGFGMGTDVIDDINFDDIPPLEIKKSD